jgi:hypothetical protein
MKSPQEVLLNQLSQATIGANFAFEPDEYRKGNAKREPADLVWACNNCIILMYMAQRKHKQRTVEAHAQMRQALIKHNLGQAKGWLTEWRGGTQPLKGENARQSFHIKYGDFQHIVVLSVLDCGDDSGYYHQSFVEQTGVALCATLSQDVILSLLSIGGSMYDLLSLIKSQGQLARQGQSFIPNMQPDVYRMQLDIVNSVDPNRKWLKEIPDQITQWVRSDLHAIRAPNPIAFLAKKETDDYELGAALNDIGIFGLYQLVFNFREIIEETEPDSYRSATLSLKLPGVYCIILTATTFMASNVINNLQPSLKLMGEQIKREDIKGVLEIIWDTKLSKILVSSTRIKDILSNTERLFQ